MIYFKFQVVVSWTETKYGHTVYIVSLESLSFIFLHLCTVLIDSWLSVVTARHRYTVALGLGTNLLHHSAFHLLPVVPVFGVAAAFPALWLAVGGIWYGLMSSLTYRKIAFEELNSCKYIVIFIVYFQCCFCTWHFIGFIAVACNKVVYSLFNFVISLLMFFKTVVCFGLVLFVC